MKIKRLNGQNDWWKMCFVKQCRYKAKYELDFENDEALKYGIRSKKEALTRYGTMKYLLLCEKHYVLFLQDKPDLLFDTI